MKIKRFVNSEIQYFELGIFSFNSYVYYLSRGFIASTRAFNLPNRAFSLLTWRLELVTRGFEIVTRGFEFVTRNSCFTFPKKIEHKKGFFLKKPFEKQHQKDVIRTDKLSSPSSYP